MTVRIGAVTGDGRYFLLTEDRRRELGLPVSALRPVLSRATHVYRAEVTRRDWESLKSNGDRVWLFRPPDRLLDHPAVRRYLRLSLASGGCERNRLQVLRREPDWHRVKLPKAPDGFVTGMGRHGPWIALRRHPTLTATNTLYVVRFALSLSIEQKAAWALMLMTEQVQEQARDAARQYPDGLLKVEPGDFARLRVPEPARVRGALQAYRSAVQHLLSGDATSAAKLAERYLR